MANLVITTSQNTITITANDLETVIGFTSIVYNKSSVSTEMNLSNIDMFFRVANTRTFRFSYNGSTGSYQVDTVNGATPSSNTDLLNKINTEINIQAIPDQTGNNGKYLQTNGSVTSWQPASGGSGLQQYQVRRMIRR